ncbi:MAG: VCBS repeat-containing protein [Acidimicrobiia bacterium]|nr:VCBS repeat-containing protein [Acidimicrobiia bacterium]
MKRLEQHAFNLARVVPAAAVLLLLVVALPGCESNGSSPDPESSPVRVLAELGEAHAGPPYEGTGAAVTGQAWADFDSDGRLDLYTTDQAGPNMLYRAKADGSFETDVWAEDVSLVEFASTRATWQQLNGDPAGVPELAVLTDAGIRIYRYDGPEAGFADVTAASQLPQGQPATALAWNDTDLDGRLDLFLAHLDGTWGLWHNDGDFRFSPVTADAAPGPPVVAAALWDLVGDTRPDLFLVRPDRTQLLGADTYTEVAAPSITDGRGVTVGTGPAGRARLFVARYRSASALSVLDSDGTTLTDATSQWPDVDGPTRDVTLTGPDQVAYLTRDRADVLVDTDRTTGVDLDTAGSGVSSGVGGNLVRGSVRGPYRVLDLTHPADTITILFGYDAVGASARVEGSDTSYPVGVGPATGSGNAPAVTLASQAAVDVTVTWPDGTEQRVRVTDRSPVWRVTAGAAAVPLGS